MSGSLADIMEMVDMKSVYVYKPALLREFLSTGKFCTYVITLHQKHCINPFKNYMWTVDLVSGGGSGEGVCVCGGGGRGGE